MSGGQGQFNNSPRGEDKDVEAGTSSFTEYEESPFDITSTKNAPVERLRRWRQAALVLNASRRFRYTLDLKREEDKKRMLRKMRAHAQAIRAAHLFKAAASRVNGIITSSPPSPGGGDFGIGQEQIVSISRDQNIGALQELGGVKGLSGLLKTNLEKGIHGDDDDISKRKSAFGSNTYPQKKGRSFWRFVWEASQDLTLIILIVAAAASLALGIKTEGIEKGWYDGISIAFAVLLVIVVTATSDYRQSLQFQNLNEEKRNIRLEVTRDGRRVEISIYDIVVGDIIPLNIGDQVPADGVLVAGHSLAVDESSMTGESKIVHKNSTKNPFLMSGCKVADGHGTMLVTGVGVNTEWGLLMASVSEDNGGETPLQVRLNGVATFIGIVGLTVAGVVLFVLVVRYFTGHTKGANGAPQFVGGHTKFDHVLDDLVKIITVAVTIVVVAVPEGLPLAVTLTLAYSMRKMMADKALVRRLSACETMGSATTICSDKTGTLTLNEMTVVECYTGFQKMDPPDSSSKLPPPFTSILVEGIAHNTTGSVFRSESGEVQVSGSPTERAILNWAIKPDSTVHVHWKGAAEIVLGSCTHYMDENESPVDMSGDKMAELKNAINDMAARSLRCVAIAFRNFEADKIPTDEDQLSRWVLPEDELVLLAIVGIKDPCRPGVKNSVLLCQKAGVKVRMVTGDNIQTAKAIALECGILASDSDASEPNLIEGKVFRAYSEAERDRICEEISLMTLFVNLKVMGRSSPNDKLLLVQSLKRKGHVVAVTGDGTNDAPALHEVQSIYLLNLADIGLSMGIQGTEVAKEKSDIIILDDNFESVVKVVRWGRSVYANIQKFIQFQLTVNVAALVINVVAAISSGDVPLTAVQLLWVNLIMDTLGALALATEPPTDHLMDRDPVVTVLLVLNFRGISILNLDHKPNAERVKNTVIFNAFVICQIFNEFNARKPDEFNIFQGVLRNHLFVGIICITIVLQVVIVEFLGTFASTIKLDWEMWLICIGIGSISWPLAVIGKCIPVPETPVSQYFRINRWRRNSSG
ncbi:hypothetical protein BRARA_K00865 [Brassica rapa]|uniref:Cation-transporting P-type ATPase N-terminal domain-containing protein n=1 Tax=Brassica campestris TaxID=3711 RepID=A0A397L2D9_BRACM|nr:hypothetical protein BRARA_K00865 [Brassica rapa]